MADEKKIVETKEEAPMEVTVVKTGFFTKAGMFLDKHKRKIAVGAAAFAGAVGMLIFVGKNRNHPDFDEETVNSGWDPIETDAEVSDVVD